MIFRVDRSADPVPLGCVVACPDDDDIKEAFGYGEWLQLGIASSALDPRAFGLDDDAIDALPPLAELYHVVLWRLHVRVG